MNAYMNTNHMPINPAQMNQQQGIFRYAYYLLGR